MSKIENLPVKDLRKLCFVLTRGKIDCDRMSGPDIATYITGRFSQVTIADAILSLRRSGQIQGSAESRNLEAAGARECLVTRNCTLLDGHDGPCRPKRSNSPLANAVKAAQKPPTPKKPQANVDGHNELCQGWEIGSDGRCQRCGLIPGQETQQVEDLDDNKDQGKTLSEAVEEAVSNAKVGAQEPQVTQQEGVSEAPEEDDGSDHGEHDPGTPLQVKDGEGPTPNADDFVTRPEFQGLIGELDSLFKLNDEQELARIEESRKLLSDELAAHVQNIVKNIPNQPVVIEISLPELGKTTKLKRRPHAMFTKVLCLVRAGLNVMLIGPAGSGKTTLAEDIAIALDRAFAFQSCTAGMSEGAITGKLLPLGNGGAMRYVSSPFVCGFGGEKNTVGEDGLVTVVPDDDMAGVTLWDEVDAADANTLIVLNSALANGKMTIETRAASGLSTLVAKHANNVVISAANTFGTGMDLQFAGRNALDAAFLDRWYPVFVDYDPVLEAQIAGLTPPQISPWQPVQVPNDAEWRSLASWILATREKINKAHLKKTWGTRALLKAKAARYAGVSSAEIKRDLMLGWPPDHVRKVLEVE